MSRLSPIMTVEELHQLLFDLPGDTAVEVEAGIDITATTVVDLYHSPWQGPLTLVVLHDVDERRISLVKVERP
jgi:hypothetical protein